MINNISYYQNLIATKNTISAKTKTSPNFTGGIPTLTHTNIGSCMEGYIGKIRVRKGSDKSEQYLNVFKRYIGYNAENYSIKNDFGDLIGEMNIRIKKAVQSPWTSFDPNENESHVFVDELRNYSNPTTPYYKQGLEYMKDIGTRLLQIAQRRSDEAMCEGNIRLIAKGEAKDWYKNIIGMIEVYPPQPKNSKLKFCVNNPNLLKIPPQNKEPLSRIQGGL